MDYLNYQIKPIPGFCKYHIATDGTIYSPKGRVLLEIYFKESRYIRLYKNGKRYTLSVEKLIREVFGEGVNIQLDEGEVAFRFEKTSYFITNKCRVFNKKFGRWVKIFYKNGYPTVNISVCGVVQAISIIKFLKEKGGTVVA